MTAVLPAPSFLPRTLHGDRRRWHDGPTPVSLADLTSLTRQVAAEVVAGHHAVQIDAANRWSRRLHADPHLDVWLISWATEQAAELHDHGGSIGALTVVSGELTEWRWSAGQADDHLATAEEIASRGPGLRRRVLTAGSGAAFPLGHVHDVSNRRTEAAVSVHAYSPPLSAMSYYGVERGTLTRTRSELVEPGASPE
ncbi:cysteine dioxygenase family protein [Actinomycetospora corticicola]|jgi:predicted metal-dependent enzyme (double-stranded beta helix superfamily)|uniref:Putative metal-dependent enzyme (Double-stranded beta helix superfamily) n=1 Tax=Actinomycetospora corticicola TaxID=663602 RepID=A0A7Y9DWV8_9PSEU|nr:cysteine dioxygenase family protein [Actinomycetospora corticicola]NYD36926.1 putative metal-dependent enzyme (double-stranded beta helix superfamily) [Actinomycetospora corticicola]